MQNPSYPHGAQIHWGRRFSNEQQWDEVAVWTLEFFGLPGDRYITDVNVNDMTWWFRDAKDQTLFVLRNGQARCIELCLTT